MDIDKNRLLRISVVDDGDIAGSQLSHGLAHDLNTAPAIFVHGETPVQRILLVEDNADLLDLTLMMLEELGHEATGVATAEDALGLLEKDAYAMLMTDVTLPKMSGIELAGLVRARYPQMPVVVASGHGRPSALHGVDVRYLAKPYQLADLQQVIEQGLGQRLG